MTPSAIGSVFRIGIGGVIAGWLLVSGARAEIAPADVQLRWAVAIPLRDSVHLNATVYLPKVAAAPAPCVFTLTPYIADSYHDRGLYFAAHGLPFVVVDVRGRGNSEGTFRPFAQEAQDGYDVVEWLAKQPFCNGKVAMWGGSYAGYDQWATAKELPPHLATIVPAAAPYVGIDFPMRNNIFFPYAVQWLTFTGGRALQVHIFGDKAFWSSLYRRQFEAGTPFRETDQLRGSNSPVFQEWVAHPALDGYWDSFNPTPAQYSQDRYPRADHHRQLR